MYTLPIEAVAVLFGGWSHESNLTAHLQVIEALEQLGITPIPISVNDPDFIQTLTRGNFQVAFLTNQGAYGEDGKLQGLLEILNIKYIGSGVCSSAIGMNKLASKLAFMGMGLTVADYYFISVTDECNSIGIIDRLGLPLVVKPVMGGSSFGVKLVHSSEELEQAIAHLQTEFGDVLVEAYIESEGYEYAAGILETGTDTISLPVCQIQLQGSLFDYEGKYGSQQCKKDFPNSLDPLLSSEIQRIALQIHTSLGCAGLSRSDFRVDKDGQIYVLEINTSPSLLPTSIYPKGCHMLDISYPQLISMLLESALVRKPGEIPKLFI